MIDHDETIIIYVRKHWLLFALQIFPLIITAVLPIIFPAILDIFLPQSLERFESAGWALYCMWLMVVWVWGFVLWTEYYLDVWVVTDKKIIGAEQYSLFHRNVATLEIEKIQDLSVEVSGLIQTIFRFGTLRVQTAGELRKFELTWAYRPEEAKEIILHTQEMLREENIKKQSAFVRNGLGY